jgi:hypothetical protein
LLGAAGVCAASAPLNNNPQAANAIRAIWRAGEHVIAAKLAAGEAERVLAVADMVFGFLVATNDVRCDIDAALLA